MEDDDQLLLDDDEDAEETVSGGRSAGALEILYHEWPSFFDTFTRNHEGDPVFIELASEESDFDGSADTEIMAEELPLIGITADFNDGPEGSIQIIVGDEPDDHITHSITRPTHVWQYQAEDGEGEIIEIEAANGPATLVHF